MTSLVFPLDGSLLVSTSTDRTAKLWRPSTWVPLHLHRFESPVGGAAFCEGDEILVCAGDLFIATFDKSQLFPAKVSDECMRSFGHLKVAATFEGVEFATVKSDTIRIYRNLFMRRQPDLCASLVDSQEQRSHDLGIRQLQFSRDGSLLVSCGEERKVKLWETATGRLVARLPVAGTDAVFAAFNPTTPCVAVTGNEETTIYELGGCNVQDVYLHHHQPVRTMAFSSDGEAVASLADVFGTSVYDELVRDASLTTFSPAGGRAMATQSVGDRYDRTIDSLGNRGFVSHHPTSPVVVYGVKGANQCHCLDLRDGHLSLDIPRALRLSGGFAKDGQSFWGTEDNRQVVSFCWPGFARRTIWSNANPNPNRGGATVESLCVGERWVLAGTQGDATKLLRVSDGQMETQWASPGGPVYSVALSPDESLAVSGTQEGTVQVVRIPRATPFAQLRAHRDQVTSVAFSPDGQFLATASRDQTVRLWQRLEDSFMELLVLPAAGAVIQIAFSPDGHKLAMLVHNERAVRLWHLDRLRARLEQMGLGW